MNKILAKVIFPFAWLLKKIAALYYDFKVLLHQKLFKKKREKVYRKNTNRIRDAVFYAIIMAIPIGMFLLVNIFINGNAVLMAFQEYDPETEGFFFLESGETFKHFKYWFNLMSNDVDFQRRMSNSLIAYLCSTVLCTFVPILFSYYVYKKLLGHGVFKILLFLPSILSPIITVAMFKLFANEVLTDIVYKMTNYKSTYIETPVLLENGDKAFSWIIFYGVFMGLGGGLLTQLAAMNTVEPSVAESAQLDGVGFFGEFWHVVLPACYEVLTLGFVTGIAGIFTNELNLYAFYDTGAPPQTETIGYFIYTETLKGKKAGLYPQLSAWGVMVTLVVAPLTILLRNLINRFGPSEDTHEKKRKRV